MVPVGSSKLSYLLNEKEQVVNGSWKRFHFNDNEYKNRFFSVFKPLLFSDILRVAWIDHTDGFGQVSENCRVVQIQNGRGVVTQHPGELRRNGGEVPLRCSVLTAGSSGESRRTHHWILGKVVVGAASNGVQLHQVLKVGDFSVHPFLANASALDLFMVLAHAFYINQTLRRAHD